MSSAPRAVWLLRMAVSCLLQPAQVSALAHMLAEQARRQLLFDDGADRGRRLAVNAGPRRRLGDAARAVGQFDADQHVDGLLQPLATAPVQGALQPQGPALHLNAAYRGHGASPAKRNSPAARAAASGVSASMRRQR